MVDKGKTFQVAANLIMIVLTLFCLLPFLLLIISSITQENALVRNGYSFFPEQIDFAAYKYLLVDSTSIVRGYILSAFVTVTGTVANLAVTTLFAYPLSRRDLPGRAFISFFLFFTMLFNGGLVPSYIMWTQTFHIKNTIAALLFPNLMMGAFYVIMMRTYFTTNIPEAVIEAARIDGAGRWKQTIHVTLPSISSTIVIMFIMKMGTMLSVGSEKVLLLYSPATYETADVISTYVYRNAFETYDYGFSTAVGLFNSVVNTVFLVSANFLCKKYTETSLF